MTVSNRALLGYILLPFSASAFLVFGVPSALLTRLSYAYVTGAAISIVVLMVGALPSAVQVGLSALAISWAVSAVLIHRLYLPRRRAVEEAIKQLTALPPEDAQMVAAAVQAGLTEEEFVAAMRGHLGEGEIH